MAIAEVAGGDPGATVELESRLGGPTVVTPTQRGFGGRLLEQGLASELAGEVRLDYHPTGLSCRMDLSLHALEPAE
jgi:two-component sensor histidine kinase